MSKLWLSIDPSKAATGVAVWRGTELQRTFVIKPRGNKGKYYFGDEIVDSLHGALDMLAVIPDPGLVSYTERGMGAMKNAVYAQGWVNGLITQAFFHEWQLLPKEVVVSEWRRVIKEENNVSWPAKRERKKALAIDLTKQLYGIEVSEDEADAVLLGRACIRMFNIRDEE